RPTARRRLRSATPSLRNSWDFLANERHRLGLRAFVEHAFDGEPARTDIDALARSDVFVAAKRQAVAHMLFVAVGAEHIDAASGFDANPGGGDCAPAIIESAAAIGGEGLRGDGGALIESADHSFSTRYGASIACAICGGSESRSPR